MYEITEQVCAILPADKPRYLMGVGTPANILESIALGIDMMDCVLPTRNARHGILYTTQGIMNMKNEKWKDDFSPIDPELGGYVDTFYSRAYLRHLFKCDEILAAQIASIHNLSFFLWLVGQAREHILAGDFVEWKNKMVRQCMTKF
jgi:queuine tRNA-ribosyltransferase